MPLQTGQILDNRYRIVHLLGQGGFGAVYRAWDMNMECPRALKENLDTSPEAQKQFKREAMILGHLSHQNLPNVIDHFIVPNQGQYLVMDFVEGEDLQAMLEKAGGPLPESQVIPWIAQICDALQYLHSQQPPIIHRDIKPANIKITPQGKAKLVDFGIAKIFDPFLSTTVGARAVTPGYSPHEQYGQGKTDPRTDIYALGATLYTLLTRLVPVESIQRMIRDPLVPPGDANPSISPNIAGAILQAMRNDPDQRPPSAQAFKALIAGSDPVPPFSQLSQPTSRSTQAHSPAASLPSVTRTRPVTSKVVPRWVPWAAVFVLLAVMIISFWPESGPTRVQLTQTALAFVPAVTVTPKPTAIPASPTPLPPSPTPLPPTPTPLPPSPTPLPTIGSTQISPLDGMVLVYIPAGTFEMGSEDGDGDERPVHSVYLDAFWMDQTEVTLARFREFMAAESYSANPCGNGDDYPVTCVSWIDAQAYCEWAGRRLPTEAQWEKAARGELVGAKYPWGDEDPVCTPGATNGAQFKGCSGDAEPVKTFSPNGYGLYDMVGNLWEWVLDWYDYDYYSSSPESNPGSPPSGTLRVLRGGSWFNIGHYLRVANRSYESPDARYLYFGFRCALGTLP